MDYQNVLNISMETDYDLDGTSPLEVYSLTFFVPICSFILWLSENTFQWPLKTFQILDLIVLNLSLLLALTVFSENLVLYLAALLLLTLIVVLLRTPHFSRPRTSEVASVPVNDLNERFVRGYRGHLLLATCTCILAVDFGAFPSRFAKTETFGWSVMDAGVGSFVVLHGLTSAHGKGAVHRGFKKCVSSSLPLLVLGFVRLAAISATGYHKVVPEYGIHWNFFFTLAFTKLVCHSVLDAAALPAGLLALAAVLVHQWLLSAAGLSTLVLSESRANLLEANKEGLCSLLGFVALYFCGVQMGRSLVWRKGSRASEYWSLLLRLCGVGAGGWAAMLALHSAVQPVSRRMANMAYCVWVVALTSLQLALHLFQELSVLVVAKRLGLKRRPDSLLWAAIHHDGLAYFLLANLLTGLVNMGMDTGKASDLTALLVLLTYLTLLTTTAVLCYRNSFRLRFW